MAKRFTDTDKWKKPFIRGLQGAYKLLWLYICDDCDHAGIWQVDIDVARIRIGENVESDSAIRLFGDKIIVFDGGSKWFIPSFIDFQYPSGLNPQNNAHSGIIRLLEKYKLLENKPLTSPSQGDKVMVMDKVMDKVKEEIGEKKKKPDVTIPKKDDFLKYCQERCAMVGYDWSEYEHGASTKYDAWVENGWKDLKGNPINGWKGKVVSNLEFFKGKLNGFTGNGKTSAYQEDLLKQRSTFKPMAQ